MQSNFFNFILISIVQLDKALGNLEKVTIRLERSKFNIEL
jgi:hypothetical protein